MRKNKKYARKLTKHEFNKRTHIALLTALIICSAIIGFTSQLSAYNEPEYKPISRLEIWPEADPMKSYVLKAVYSAGLNPDEVECLINHESGWDNWKYGINTNGTTDMGLWQINSIHKGTISVKDRFDYKASTKWAIEKRLHDGNWNAWYGFNQCKDLAIN